MISGETAGRQTDRIDKIVVDVFGFGAADAAFIEAEVARLRVITSMVLDVQ